MADNPCFDHEDDAKDSAMTKAQQTDTSVPGSGKGGDRERRAGLLARVWRNMTVEPIVTAYYVTNALTTLGVQNMMLYKACWPDEAPAQANATCPTEADSQRVVADINTWKPFVMHLLPVLCLAYAGSWSDNHGGRRKPLILLPLLGRLCMDVCLVVNALFWRWPPVVTALADALPYGMTGGTGVLNIGVMSYIADITTHKERTLRMGVIMVFVFMGSPIGLALGGFLSETVGFLGLFATCACINSFGLLYGAVYIRETGSKERSPEVDSKCCDVDAPMRAVRVALRPREGARRASLLMLLNANPFVIGPLIGEAILLFLFVRVKFGWSPFDYGVYACYKMTMVLIGTLISSAIFSHWLQIDDAKIGMVSSCLQTAAYIVYSMVNTGWVMYLVPFLELMNGAGITVHKSLVSKLVPNSEMGQIIAILSINEAIVPLLVHPMFSKFYQSTLDSMPGAYYLLGAVLYIPGFIIFSLVYFLNRSDKELHSKGDDDSTSAEKITEKADHKMTVPWTSNTSSKSNLC